MIVTLTFLVECFLTLVFFMIYGAIYYATEYEPLNTGSPVLFVKAFLILLTSIYNVKKMVAGLKAKDFVTAAGFVGITLVYSVLIAFLGTGRGR